MMEELDNFTRKILFDYLSGRSPARTIQEFSSNSTQTVLLEAAAIWVMVQAAVAQDLLGDPIVELWGMQNVDDWELLNNNQKINEMFALWSKEGATKEARNYIDNHPKAVPLDDGHWMYDIKDVSVPYDADIADHRQQLKKSEVFKGLKKLFTSYLARHIDKVQPRRF